MLDSFELKESFEFGEYVYRGRYTQNEEDFGFKLNSKIKLPLTYLLNHFSNYVK